MGPSYTFSRVEKGKFGGAPFAGDFVRITGNSISVGGQAARHLGLSTENNKLGIEVDEHNQAIRLFHNSDSGFAFHANRSGSGSFRMGLKDARNRLSLPVGDYSADPNNPGVYTLAK